MQKSKRPTRSIFLTANFVNGCVTTVFFLGAVSFPRAVVPRRSTVPVCMLRNATFPAAMMVSDKQLPQPGKVVLSKRVKVGKKLRAGASDSNRLQQTMSETLERRVVRPIQIVPALHSGIEGAKLWRRAQQVGSFRLKSKDGQVVHTGKRSTRRLPAVACLIVRGKPVSDYRGKRRAKFQRLRVGEAADKVVALPRQIVQG
jgi:hypothetical protein